MSAAIADVKAEHAALTGGVAVADFSYRTQVELTGDDRAKLLHNFTTGKIRELPAGGGCETFITDAKAGIVAHVFVFSGDESIVLETAAGQAAKIIAHLDRYIIRDKVELHDRSQEWAELLLAGPAAPDLLNRCAGSDVPQQLFQHAPISLAGRQAWVRRIDFTGPVDFLVSCNRADAPAIKEELQKAGAVPVGAEAVEAARIEAGSPLYGRDIFERTLPQEVNRDARTISFTKGCYLGQETVARIDALGHVNKLLVGVKFGTEAAPQARTEMTANGKSVGQVTSAAFSPRLGTPLALAYVGRGHNAVGTQLESSAGRAEVVSLPVR